ncbi:MAG: toxic anion resistance protein, partial [Oscillospiraceae bacterium]|nr:toxic anion resistance protein [Oscillospiraceae bacterium]
MDEKIPELTLTPDLTDTPAVEVSPKEAAPAPKAGPDLSSLSPAEQKAVLDFAEKIDLSNSGVVLQYGAAAQKNIANFSESTLNAVRTKDMGELGDMVSDLVAQLKGFSAEEEEKKGFLGMFKKASNNLQNMKIKYDKAEANVDKIAEQLEQHQVVLMKDVALLDQMYEKNLEYFKQLSMYILAGEKKLADERATTLQELYAKAQASGLPEDAQAANDYAALCDRFEKKLYDLKLTRQISIQMGPQIRMIQNNDTLMTEKIQTSLVNTIPLWKSQMVLALGISHSKQAMEAQRAVSDMTNELL